MKNKPKKSDFKNLERDLLTKAFAPIVYTEGSPNPIGTLILEREAQQRSVEVALTWTDGRKTFTVEATPPKSLFVGRRDILSFEK